jgi:hypothetical protein
LNTAKLARRFGQLRTIRLVGVQPRWVESLDKTYFAPGNPWIQARNPSTTREWYAGPSGSSIS